LTFSFIHTADIHLGRPFSNIKDFSNDEKIKELYKKAVEKSFNNFIEYAQNKNVDFVLIAGDTFDSDEQDFESKLILKEGLKKLENSNIKVFLICGNHDPISSYDKNTFNFNENSAIKIVGLNSNKYEDFIINDKGNSPVAIIHALSFKENYFKENPVEYFTPADKNFFNI
jgi:DNA repair exonuclease SbcCD nuclease subunit